MAKRLRYDSECKLGSIDSSVESDDTYGYNQFGETSDQDVEIEVRNYQSRRKPKCFSKNAQMARQNRLKKKIHLAKLEKKVEILKREKSDLTNIVDTQSNMLSELKKEVKYLKGILANSSDIRTLVRNIHKSTGMTVSSSLSRSIGVCNCSQIRGEYEDSIIKKDSLLSESNCIQFSDLGDYSNTDHLLDMNTDLDSFLNTTDLGLNIRQPQQIPSSLEEHNYTSKLCEEEDYGICLHVCKNKVSLEFCSSCEENARRSSAYY